MSRPVTRGFLAAAFKKDFIVCMGITAVAVVAHRLIWVEPAKQRYADFYKTYDPEEHFQSMKKKGLLHSARPEDEE